MPAPLALVTRGLINDLIAASSGDVEITTAIVPWIPLGCVLSLIVAVCRHLDNLLTARLSNLLYLELTSDILSHTATLDLAVLEKGSFQDILNRAQKNSAENISSFLTNSLTVLQNVVLIGSLSVHSGRRRTDNDSRAAAAGHPIFHWVLGYGEAPV